ncbi:Kelch repeat protein [Neofusicoccum parvum]|nr:Kelch repeat protein [Neofusicoccum parvum]
MWPFSLSRSQRAAAALYVISCLGRCIEASPLSPLSQHEDSSLASPLSRRQSSNPTASNFIRRALHASVVVGSRLYIDGGELAQYVNGDTDTAVSRINNQTLSIDLSTAWTNDTVQISALDKDGAPVFNFPGLWSDGNSAFYLFAGEVSPVAGDASTPDVALWKFSSTPAGGGSWAKQATADPQVFNQLTRPANALVATGQSTGYVLGGYASARTDPDSTSADVPVPGIVAYDWESQKWSNSSAAAFTTFGTAVSGQMHFVPAFGKDGLLFMFGGESTTPTAWSEKSGQLQFNNITMYDPAAGSWYSQVTTGDAPPVRELFCVAGAEGNNGTYEIFVMGGWDAFQGVCYDDMYILSVPGFHWFKAPTISGGPRAFHTCNVVGKRQMLVVGGVNYNLGVPGDWKDPDPWSQGLGVFDMTNLSWSSSYDPAAAAYNSPDKVRAWYKQGNGDSVSWTNNQVRALFASTNGNSGNSGSGNGGAGTGNASGAEKSSSNTGAIVGGVVGGVAGLALLAGLAWLLLRRRKRNAAAVAAGEKQHPGSGGGYAYQQAPGGLAEVDGREVERREKRPEELPAGEGNEVHELAGDQGVRK